LPVPGGAASTAFPRTSSAATRPGERLGHRQIE
jgi:hypothetical protein